MASDFRPTPNIRPGEPGWIVTCPYCDHSWKVGREVIMCGTWLRCPQCAGEKR